MKYIAPLLAGGLTLLIVLVVGIYSFLPPERPSQAVVVQPPAQQDTTQLEAMMTEREKIYQAQIEELNRVLQERQVTYQTQIQELSGQIPQVINQLNELKAQE